MPGLIKPLRFRFTAPADIERYGDRWWVYDESVWTQFPARRLVEIEQEIGHPLVDVMAGVRASSSFGDMAAAWLAMSLDPTTLVGPYAQFNPHTMLMEWETITESEPAVEAPKEPAPAVESVEIPLIPDAPMEAPRPDWFQPSVTDPGPGVSNSPGTSGTDTVSLPNMPVAGSSAF